MEFYKDWNFWLAIFTAGTALLAIFQTQRQIKLSNKQQLYDKRVEIYEKADSILGLWSKAKDLFESNETSPIRTIDYRFLQMTNSSYLEKCYLAVKNPKESPYHIELLKKLEEIRGLGLHFSLLFSGMEAQYVEEFLYCYQDLLMEMYRYKIVLMDVDKEIDNTVPMLRCMGFREKIGENYDEPGYRFDVVSKSNKLKNIYDRLKSYDSEAKLKRQITLLR